MNFSLPYAGFNWSLTQHMGMTSEAAVRAMLKAAHDLNGVDNFRDRFATRLSQEGFFTPNIRTDSGRADAWRDYQQVLSELGLIVSTAYTGDSIHITPIGLLVVDRALGFDDAITTQALRYQYPNGHKTAVPNAAKNTAAAFSVTKRTELDAAAGVLVKPAILILRALIDLHETGDANSKINVDECCSLISIRNHIDPALPAARVLETRRTGLHCRDLVLRRNVAEWFTLLNMTSLFSGNRQKLELSAEAKANLPENRSLCEYHENPTSFWQPIGQYPAYALDWYEYFGNPPVEAISESNVLSDSATAEHLEQENAENLLPMDFSGIREPGLGLVPFVEPPGPSGLNNAGVGAVNVTAEDIQRAIETRQEGTRLHEEIVGLARARLLERGFDVYRSQAVDLLGKRTEGSVLVEVKTVTRRNVIKQMRLGIGQLSEYRYRHGIESGYRPEAILLISSRADLPTWMVDYFRDEAILGVSYRSGGSRFGSYAAGPIAAEVFSDI